MTLQDLYVAGFHLQATPVIDPTSASIVATVVSPGGYQPEAICLTPDGTKAISIGAGWAVTVVDTASNTVLSETPVGAPFSFGSIVATNSLAFVPYSSGSGGFFLAIFDLTSLTWTYTSFNCNTTVSLSPDNNWVYFGGGGFAKTFTGYHIPSGTASVIPTDPSLPDGVDWTVVSRDSTKVYGVDPSATSTAYSADVGATTYLHTLLLPDESDIIAVSPNGSTVFCVGSSTGVIYVIDAATMSLIRADSLGGNVSSIYNANSPDKTYVKAGSRVWVYDTVGNLVTSFPSAGDIISMTPDQSTLFVLDVFANALYLYDPTTGALHATISGVGNEPQGMTTVNLYPFTPPFTPLDVPPIFIPRKLSLDPTDLQIDWLAVENWANRLWSATH